MSEGQVAGRWLEHVRAMCKRFSDPGLSALLAVEVVLIFVMFPLAAAEGFDLPLVVTVAIAAGLIFLVVLGSDNRGALVVAVVAAGCTLLAGGVELIWATPVSEAATAISAVLSLFATMWVISGVVFGPGRITVHRIRGAIVLYLTFALIFAWLYRLLAQTTPGCFSGLTFRPGELGSLSSFIYFSLTVLTTVGFGDITPVNDFVRNLTMLEALLGQLYPAVILARLLTLYADDRTTEQ